MKINRSIYVFNSLLVIGVLQAGVANAVPVDVNSAPCGDLESMQITSDAVSITTLNGSCAGIGDLPQAADLTATVSEGATKVIDLSAGASVKLPFSVQSVQQPSLGSVSSPSGSNVTYTAPAPGTVSGDSQQTVFTYTLQDATPATDQGQVTVTVLHSDSVPPPSGGGDCTSTSTLLCMGALPFPAGTSNNNASNVNQAHAWSFTYDGHQGQISWADGIPKDGNISVTAGDFSPAWPCAANDTGQGTVKFAVAGQAESWECALVDGQQYFFNIKTSNGAADGYDLSTY